MASDADNRDHLSADEVAAYLEHRVDQDERTVIESHLADCATCRREVIDLSRVQPTRNITRWLVWGSVAATATAASIAIILIASHPQAELTNTRFRDNPSTTIPTSLPVVAPRPGDFVSRDSVVFAWRPLDPEASYHLTLTDASGGLVWEATTRDTLLRLSPDIITTQGETYLWYVDGFLTNGTSVTTGIQSLRFVP